MATGNPRGESVSVQVMYDLSAEWYRGRLEEAWMPIGPDLAQATFARHGLAGDFWALA